MDEDRYAKIAEYFIQRIPHVKDMGMQISRLDTGLAVVCVSQQSFMLGNTRHNLINGGVISSLVDTACGMAVCTLINESERIATLDLRIDNLRPAVGDLPLVAEAECYHMTPQIAFVKAVAYQDNRERLIANSMSTFIRKKTGSGSTPA